MNTLKKSTKMASIEAARAFAAISVVLMHCANAMNVDHFSGHVGINSIFDFGYVGVDFFFVLSGFI
jgi:peptidoglycan/LPS O-acetylase OafA/YrhL